MKRSAVYVALLLVIVIVVAVLCLRIFTKETLPEQPEPTKEVTVLPPVADEPTHVSVPETEAPAATPEPPRETEKPFETRAPIETEPPAAPEPFHADGSFRSDTGTYLNLVAEWAASDSGGESVTLRVLLSAESYSFNTSALYNSLQLTVNGTTYSANSPEVSYTGDALTRTPLAEFAVELPRGTATVEAVWHYKGSYSGTELEDITASATISLG